jgi:hypothetical protein
MGEARGRSVALDKGRRLLEGMPTPRIRTITSLSTLLSSASTRWTVTGRLGKTDSRGLLQMRFYVPEGISTARSGHPCETRSACSPEGHRSPRRGPRTTPSSTASVPYRASVSPSLP